MEVVGVDVVVNPPLALAWWQLGIWALSFSSFATSAQHLANARLAN